MKTILGYREDPLKVESEEGDDPGWDWNARSYCFRPIRENPRGAIVTASVMTCASCSKIIKSMGGPGYRCYCVSCYDQIKLVDFAEGHEHTIQEK